MHNARDSQIGFSSAAQMACISLTRHGWHNNRLSNTSTLQTLSFFFAATIRDGALRDRSNDSLTSNQRLQALQRTHLLVTAPASTIASPPTMQVPRSSGVSLS